MTAFIIAIEGGDGVGKNTIANALAHSLRSKSKSVAVIDFPRYGDTLAGGALKQFLNGRAKRPVSAQVAAVLYALDRLEYRDEIQKAVAENDFVIFDRYVASNIAYQAAKVPSDDRSAMMDWVSNIELDIFSLPKPNLNVLLRLDVTTARDLVSQKPKRDYTSLEHDVHEADDTLQARLRENYERMADQGMPSSWTVIDVSRSGLLRTPSEICTELERRVEELGALATA